MLDVMNKEPKQLSEEQKAKIDKVKTMGNEFYDLVKPDNNTPAFYETILAMNKIEEAVMWAVKGICNT